MQQMGPFAFRAFRRKQQLLQSVNQPRLAIDLNADTTRVVDPNSNALIATARVAQVTATPETYQYRYGFSGFGSPDKIVGRMFERSMASSLSTTPVLVLCIPGGQPLTIGCRDTVDVRQRVNEPPTFRSRGRIG
jgi:hypothetical protein